jgi:hypothetical protein
VTVGEGENPDAYVLTSLRAERWFLDCVKQLSASLSAVNQLSRGTDNLLQGIEDKHEEHVYLLLQRSQTVSKTASDWKKNSPKTTPKIAADPWKATASDSDDKEDAERGEYNDRIEAMKKEFSDWIDDVIKKGQAAKKELASASSDPGRASTDFVAKVIRLRDEEWHDFFYR